APESRMSVALGNGWPFLYCPICVAVLRACLTCAGRCSRKSSASAACGAETGPPTTGLPPTSVGCFGGRSKPASDEPTRPGDGKERDGFLPPSCRPVAACSFARRARPGG